MATNSVASQDDSGSWSAGLYWEEVDIDWASYAILILWMAVTCDFYGSLAEEDRDAAYYGNMVGRNAPNAPLIPWQVSEDECRIIYGNLRSDTPSPEQTEALEAGITN